MLKQLTSTSRLHAIRLNALGAAVVFMLAACGGVGGSSSASLTSLLNGELIDGPIEGARVFLDLNGNLVHDDGEPISGLTDSKGAFSIATNGLSAAQIDSAMLVSVVPDTAKDADDAGKTISEAGKQGFTLLAPVNAFVDVVAGGIETSRPAVISPLTTLVAGEILHNGLTLIEARAAVKQEHGLTRDPLENFIAARDATTANIARAAAVALGQAGRSVAEVAQSEGGLPMRDQMQAIVQTVRESLPAIVDRLELKNPSKQAPSVTTLVTTMETEQALSTKSADRVAIQAAGRPTNPSTGKPVSTAAPEFHDYIVVFKNTVGNPAQEAASAAVAHGGTVRFTYANAIKGFAVRLPVTASEAFLNAMSNNPNVDYVETDAPVSTRLEQSSPPWGLDRVDDRDLILDKNYTYNVSGNGIRAYVVDTGILETHLDFGGRVLYTQGYTAISDGKGTTDCNGHGTHVAGTIGSSTYGIAKSVSLVPVRVLDCAGSGSLSGVIAGLDWIIADPNRGSTASVVNMSLGGGASISLDSAVAKVVSSGIIVIVAAGNDNANACNYSPAREPSAITVGATTSSDARASYSNFGSCLDLFAPGSAITSTWYTSTSATASLNGTSMAAPHVAGLAALILGSTTDITPADVTNMIKTSATTNKVLSAGTGSPNLLLYTLASTSSEPSQPITTLSVSVGSLTGSAAGVRNGWQATVAVAVKDKDGNMVSGATVAGGFTEGGSSVSCTTASNGLCSVKTGAIGKRVAQTVYSVTKISGTNMSYDSSNNIASSITIRQP